MAQNRNENKRILIVEDSPDLQVLLTQLLIDEGYDVSNAYHGKEALDLLRSKAVFPALILLDIMMPVMDGLVFRNELEKDKSFAGIPILFMTADSHPETKIARINHGDFIRKPIDVKRFLEVVARNAK